MMAYKHIHISVVRRIMHEFSNYMTLSELVYLCSISVSLSYFLGLLKKIK